MWFLFLLLFMTPALAQPFWPLDAAGGAANTSMLEDSAQNMVVMMGPPSGALTNAKQVMVVMMDTGAVAVSQMSAGVVITPSAAPTTTMSPTLPMPMTNFR